VIFLLLACTGSPPAARAGGVPVILGPVTHGPAEVSLTLIGELQSTFAANVSAETAGVVERIPARVGDRVRAGDILVVLDEKSARIALSAAKAREAQAEAEVSGKQAARDRVASETQRIRELAQKNPGSVSSMELQAAELSLKEAEAAMEQANAGARLRQAERQALALELERCRLKSPVEGVVVQQEARLGQRVAAGTLLTEVVSLTQGEVLLSVGSQQSGQVEPGDGVVITVPQHPELSPQNAVVSGVVPAATGASRSQWVRVDLNPLPSGWLPGLAVEAEVVLERLEQATQVPRDALVGGAVFAVAEGKAKRIPVQLQHDQGELLVVTGELAGVTEVVIRGNEALSDGTAVTLPASTGKP
jgi:RND family efflux transporter MFP subunit